MSIPPAPKSDWLETAKNVAQDVFPIPSLIGKGQAAKLLREGIPIGEITEQQAAKIPDDPAHWFLNTVVDLGIRSGKAIQNLTKPENLALIGAMAAGGGGVIPALAALGFSAEMAEQATEAVAKGVQEAKKGNLREAGRLFGSAGVNALLIALAGRKPKGEATYRVLGTERVAPKPAAGETLRPEGETKAAIPETKAAVPETKTEIPPAPRASAFQAPGHPGERPLGTDPMELAVNKENILQQIAPRTIRAEGRAITVTPDDIQAYVRAKMQGEGMKVKTPDGEVLDLGAGGQEDERIREHLITKPLFQELFGHTAEWKPNETVGQVVDRQQKLALENEIKLYINAKVLEHPNIQLGSATGLYDLDESSSRAQEIRATPIPKAVFDRQFGVEARAELAKISPGAAADQPHMTYREGETVGEAVDEYQRKKIEKNGVPGAWQMTQGQYLKHVRILGNDPEVDKQAHRQAVETSLTEGRRVPDEVLAELRLRRNLEAEREAGPTPSEVFFAERANARRAGKPIPPAPKLELAPTRAPRPLADPGWKLTFGSFTAKEGNAFRDRIAKGGFKDSKLVPDPNNPGRFYVSYAEKEKPVVAPKGLAPARALPPTPSPVAQPEPGESRDQFVERRLKEITSEQGKLLTSGKLTPEQDAQFDRLSREAPSLLREWHSIQERRQEEAAAKAEEERKPAQPPPPSEPTPEQKAQQEVIRAGAEWKGMQEPAKEGQEPYIAFNDPRSKSTLLLPLSQANKENIEARIKESRARYDAARTPDEPLETGPAKKFIFEHASTMYAGNKPIPVEYGYMEKSDIVGSHDSFTWTPNLDHPGQTRYSYETDKEQQADVERMFMNPQAERTITDSISPLEGPPMAIPDGSLAGGNKRFFWIEKMYGSKEPYAPLGGISRAAYLKGQTVKEAQRYETAGVEEMAEPVRVRRIKAPGTMGEWMDLTKILNDSPSAEQKPGEKAMFYAGRVTPTAVGAISSALEDLNPDASILQLMAAYPVDFVTWLQDSGALDSQDRLKYIDPKTGGLNDAGKDMYQNALLAKVLNDARLLDTSPQAVIDRMASSLGPILRLSVRGGQWDIRSLLMQAAEIMGDAVKHNRPLSSELDEIRNPELGLPRIPRVVAALAEFLDRKLPLVKKGIRQFASESSVGTTKAQGSFVTQEPEPYDSFKASFTVPVEEPEPPPHRTKKGKVVTETAPAKAKRLAENERSKRRMARYADITKEEYENALRDAHEARLRANKEKFPIRPGD